MVRITRLEHERHAGVSARRGTNSRPSGNPTRLPLPQARWVLSVEYVGVQARLNQHFVPPFLFANGHAYSEAGHGFVSDWEAWN
jgi:hypothetical protein